MPRVSANSMTSIERALAILETLAYHRGLTNSDLSKKLGLPKSSASYILRILEASGYLLRDPESGRYGLTPKINSFTLGALGNSRLCKIALPFLQSIVHQTNFVACLLVLDGADVLNVERVNCPPMRIEDWISPRLEIHATAGGKAILAHLPEEETGIVLSHHGLRRWTPNTITSLTRLSEELREVRRQGYAVDRGEYVRGLYCVAAPIFGPLGEVGACIGVAGAFDQMDESVFPRVGAVVRDSARIISEQLRCQVGRAPAKLSGQCSPRSYS